MSHTPLKTSYPTAQTHQGSAPTRPGTHVLEENGIAHGTIQIGAVPFESAPAKWLAAARYSVKVPDDGRQGA